MPIWGEFDPSLGRRELFNQASVLVYFIKSYDEYN